MATGILPREFAFKNKVVKLPWSYRGSYFEINTPSFYSPWFRLSYGDFCHLLFLIGNFVMVDSPRFPKSSGIDPKKALPKTHFIPRYFRRWRLDETAATVFLISEGGRPQRFTQAAPNELNLARGVK